MNYNTLESIVRSAACKTFGARSTNFDEWLVTYDIDEDVCIDELDLGTVVELSFEPSISPVKYFSSDVVFYVGACNSSAKLTPPAAVQAFFGNACKDIEAAEEAASDFLDRGPDDGWYVEDYFDEGGGLHLVRVLGFEFESEEAFAKAVENAFAELLDHRVADKLRSFIHYFED